MRKLFCEYGPVCYQISLKKETLKRHLKDFFSNTKIAKTKVDYELPILVKAHTSLLVRKYVNVVSCECVGNALDEIIKAEQNGLIKIVRYKDFIAKREKWLYSIIKNEYAEAVNHPEYQFFLRGKFSKYLD